MILLKIDLKDITNLTVQNLLTILFILVCTVILNRTVRWLINKGLVSESRKLSIDHTKFAFFKNALSLFIWIIALITIIYTIPAFRSLALTLFTGAGILVAIAGFAAQQAFSNIVSGMFIVIFKPFRVGDQIKVGDKYYGIVEDITLRHTIINNFENRKVIIPNALISAETVINDTIIDEKICMHIEVGISYDSDIDKAMQIVREVAMAHPDVIDNRTSTERESGMPQVVVRLSRFGDHYMNIKAFVWTEDPYNMWQVQSDLNVSIKKRFDEAGIEIPFPYRTIVFKDKQPDK